MGMEFPDNRRKADDSYLRESVGGVAALVLSLGAFVGGFALVRSLMTVAT